MATATAPTLPAILPAPATGTSEGDGPPVGMGMPPVPVGTPGCEGMPGWVGMLSPPVLVLVMTERVGAEQLTSGIGSRVTMSSTEEEGGHPLQTMVVWLAAAWTPVMAGFGVSNADAWEFKV